MMFCFIVLLAVFSAANCAQRCCNEINHCFTDDDPFDHMPLPTCPNDLMVSMRVYTQSNPDVGQVITRDAIPPIWQNGKMTVFIVHGWLGGRNSNWMANMKDDMLVNHDYNVIVVGWEEGSRQLWYPQSASDTRAVGADIAATMFNIMFVEGEDPSNFYCTGHSLGSHVCGHAGMRLTVLSGQVMGRITGMDPAGPWFGERQNIRVGLNPDAAQTVDVMHTNGEAGIILALGTMRRLGHKDFYPNGGGTQPGCILDPFDVDNPIEGTGESFIDLTPACSHMRTLDYYLESILESSDCFKARYKCTDQHNMPGSCTFNPDHYGVMGFNADTYEETGIFYLQTNRATPFCQG